ncbi:MAG: hypothetical protein ACI9D5_002274 [Candidatus Endobugula sp.]|jgi:uncharacterized protein YeaC (DUF1315 family)
MMTNVQELLDSLTPEIYHQLKQVVELGKWPTGGKLSVEQKNLCIQAVIAYEQKHYKPEEYSGYVPPKKHSHCGSAEGIIADDEVKSLLFKE